MLKVGSFYRYSGNKRRKSTELRYQCMYSSESVSVLKVINDDGSLGEEFSVPSSCASYVLDDDNDLMKIRVRYYQNLDSKLVLEKEKLLSNIKDIEDKRSHIKAIVTDLSNSVGG
jgi:hypothetical protein